MLDLAEAGDEQLAGGGKVVKRPQGLAENAYVRIAAMRSRIPRANPAMRCAARNVIRR
jgi:hypothetical protein